MIVEVRSPRDRPVGVKHAYRSSASRASDGCCTRAILALIGDGHAEQDYNRYEYVHETAPNPLALDVIDVDSFDAMPFRETWISFSW